MTSSRLYALGIFATTFAAAALYACSSNDSDPGSFPEPPVVPVIPDGSTHVVMNDAGASDASDGATSGPFDAASYTGAGGIHVQDSTGTYDLTSSPQHAQLANGWAVNATKTGSRVITLTLRNIVTSDAGTAVPAPLVPGTYLCSANPAVASRSAVIQYSVVGGSTYQSDMTASSNCQVDLEVFGAVGARSRGSFGGHVPIAGTPDSGPGVDLTGSFEIVRQN